jgi:hypothetical protein
MYLAVLPGAARTLLGSPGNTVAVSPIATTSLWQVVRFSVGWLVFAKSKLVGAKRNVSRNARQILPNLDMRKFLNLEIDQNV